MQLLAACPSFSPLNSASRPMKMRLVSMSQFQTTSRRSLPWGWASRRHESFSIDAYEKSNRHQRNFNGGKSDFNRGKWQFNRGKWPFNRGKI